MRLAILTNNFPPILDGVGDYTYHLANELQDKGHSVMVICKENPAIQGAIQDAKFNIPVSASIPTWNWRAIRPLRQALLQQQPDWLLVQYVPNGFQLWAMPIWLPLILWLSKPSGTQLGIIFHEIYIRMTYWPPKYALVAILQRLICTLLAKLADLLITSIDLYRDLLQSHTRKPIHLIPIGSNILPVDLTSDELIATRKQIGPSGEYVISTFGLRRQDLLLQVFEEVLKQQPLTRLLICGKLNISHYHQARYEQLKDKIVITGFMSNTEVYRHLRASDVYFSPDDVNEKNEGGTCNKSGSLAAGLAAGLPIVGTMGDMNNTLLQETPGVFLEDATDLDKLTKRLVLLLTDSNIESKRQSILHFFDQTLSWKAIAGQYVTALSRL